MMKKKLALDILDMLPPPNKLPLNVKGEVLDFSENENLLIDPDTVKRLCELNLINTLMSDLKDLQKLNITTLLSFSIFEGDITNLSGLKNCSYLKEVDIYGCPIEEIGVHLNDVRCMNKLTLALCDLTDDILIPFFENATFHHLNYLNISFNEKITDESLKVIGTYCKNLKEIDLSSCSVTSDGVNQLLEKCKFIEELNIFNTGIPPKEINWEGPEHGLVIDGDLYI